LASLAEHPLTAHYEPIVQDDAVIGVLAVGWHDRDRAAPRLARRLLPLVAVEAAESIERADQMNQLAALALTDTLTGLGNRRAWDDWIDRAVQDAATEAEPRVTIALLDIDHFKAFNDTRGHQDGDRLLKEAGAAWRAHLRPGDRLARYGGEEFAVLLPGCDAPCAAIVIERLRAAMPAGQTCSAGIAQWDGQEDTAAFVARADAALYAAKEAGRDRVIGATQLPAR
jgi:diguanylate cyclase (GGDEF)-like protein